MRASTLFGLTIAILIGMAVVFGVKSAGLFSSPKAPMVAPDVPRILVAMDNLYENMAATGNQVMVRPVEPHEREQYERNRHKYMPPMVQAAHLRILARNVAANEPLLKEHFQDLGLPAALSVIIPPGMRAVNLQMPRDRAGGGIIRKGDNVDVLLTTTISTDASGLNARTATVPIALGLNVIVKRDTIFPTLQANDDSKPIPFTLAANPYRAALIEFAKNKGELTLVATGPSINDKKWGSAVTFDSKEEERKSNEVLQGEPITDQTLVEIFKLPKIEAPTFRPREWIELWDATKQRNIVQVPLGPGVAVSGSQPGYTFKAPPPVAGETPGCKTCGKSPR